MRSILASVKRYPLCGFFTLAYAISWILWSPLVVSGQEGSPQALLLIVAGGFGPLLSALFVTWAVEGRAGLREWGRAIVKWRVGASWYAVAFLFPIVVVVSGFGLHILLGGGNPREWAAPSWFAYVLGFVFVLFLGGGLEEPGWRGFALPRLQDRYGALVASLVLGLLWAFWHLPLFFSPASSQQQLGIPFLWYVPNTVALTIVFTWLYNNAGRSVFLAMLMHAQVNVTANWIPLQWREGTISLFVSVVIVQWVIAIILVVVYGPSRLSRRLQH